MGSGPGGKSYAARRAGPVTPAAFRALRESTGWSRPDVAARCGVPVSTLAAWEGAPGMRPGRAPDALTAYLLAVQAAVSTIPLPVLPDRSRPPPAPPKTPAKRGRKPLARAQ